jgi:uncharacterized damage-inducible protein DinB
MKGTEAIQTALRSTQFLLTSYISDLSDQDLLVRPADGANHIAWQLGHLITSEKTLVTRQLPQAKYPELPAGFAERHAMGADAQGSDAGFSGTQQYRNLFNQVRQATLETVAGLSDGDLDRPAEGDIAKLAPTVGDVLVLVSNHTLMHGGQFTVVRRKLGKPVLF